MQDSFELDPEMNEEQAEVLQDREDTHFGHICETEVVAQQFSKCL